MDAYMYAADLLCGPCAEKTRETLKTAPGWTFHAEDPEGDLTGDYWLAPATEGGHAFNAEGQVFHVMAPSGLLREVGGTDTDTFPAGPFADGGGESDSPQHCADCGLFLENDLTEDGLAYVAGTVGRDLSGGLLSSVAVQTWGPFYRDQLDRDLPAGGDALVGALDLGLAVEALGDLLAKMPAQPDGSPQPAIFAWQAVVEEVRAMGHRARDAMEA